MSSVSLTISKVGVFGLVLLGRSPNTIKNHDRFETKKFRTTITQYVCLFARTCAITMVAMKRTKTKRRRDTVLEVSAMMKSEMKMAFCFLVDESTAISAPTSKRRPES